MVRLQRLQKAAAAKVGDDAIKESEHFFLLENHRLLTVFENSYFYRYEPTLVILKPWMMLF